LADFDQSGGSLFETAADQFGTLAKILGYRLTDDRIVETFVGRACTYLSDVALENVCGEHHY